MIEITENMDAAQAALTERTTEMDASVVSENKVPAKKPIKVKAKKPVKTKTRKAAAKIQTRKAKPTTGQSGPEIDLTFDDLNRKEQKVFDALNGEGKGAREAMHLKALASLCFGSKSKFRANSWTRNSLRRLVCGGLVEKVDRGSYRVTDKARKRVARAQAQA